MDSARSTCTSIFDETPSGTSTRRSGIWSTGSHEVSSPLIATNFKDQFFQTLDHISEKYNETNEEKVVFSQYEPVNNILSKLQRDKLTLRKLNMNNVASDDGRKIQTNDETSISYFRYWSMSEEEIQVLQMLEPNLLSRQLRLFQLYQEVKELALDLRQMIELEIPFLKEKDHTKLNELITVHNTIYPFMNRLYGELRYIMERNILIKGNSVSAMINTVFKDLEHDKILFAKCLAAVMASEEVMEHKITAQHAKCHFKLVHFDSIISFQLLKNTEWSINEAYQSACSIQKEIQEHYKQIKRHERNQRIIKNFIYTISNCLQRLPQFCEEAFVILPFVTFCWLLFSLLSLVTDKNQRAKHKLV